MKNPFTRRVFLEGLGTSATAATAAKLTGTTGQLQAEATNAFESAWPSEAERTWVGPEYWANPLQDWRIRQGRLECISAGGDRNVAILTHRVAERAGNLHTTVRLGRLDDVALQDGFVGFRLGTKHQMDDYRSVAIYGQGMNVGLNAAGQLMIGQLEASTPTVDLSSPVSLELEASPLRSGYKAVLTARSNSKPAVSIMREVPAEWLTGGLALVCSSGKVEATPAAQTPIKDFDFYPPAQQSGGSMRFWFSDWTISGSKVDADRKRVFGPILFTLYTVSRNTLKLSAQFPSLGNAPRTVTLQTSAGVDEWHTRATAELDPDGWNATFRVTGWDATRSTLYRVLYTMPDGRGVPRQHTYGGTIRRDHIDQPDVTLGLLTCTWDFGFPHVDFTRNLAFHRPDLCCGPATRSMSRSAASERYAVETRPSLLPPCTTFCANGTSSAGRLEVSLGRFPPSA